MEQHLRPAVEELIAVLAVSGRKPNSIGPFWCPTDRMSPLGGMGI